VRELSPADEGQRLYVHHTAPSSSRHSGRQRRFGPLEGKVITTIINKRSKTMSTLYGNDIAVKAARTAVPYPPGSILSLVTWHQKEDPHWFGANIPGTVQSVNNWYSDGCTKKRVPSYTLYEGDPLKKSTGNTAVSTTSRIGWILDQQASVMP